MDEESFLIFLRKRGRSEAAAERCLSSIQTFYKFLNNDERFSPYLEFSANDIDPFVAWADDQDKPKTKTYLWGLIYYLDFMAHRELREYVHFLRQQRIVRRPFKLSGFKGVRSKDVEKLGQVGISTAADMLEAGAASAQRGKLAQELDLPEHVVLELVKLSDLARIPGIKGIRARLYVDAGIGSVEMMAASDPEKLLIELQNFADRTGFEGVVPLPAELRFSVQKAKTLPIIVEH